MIPRFVVVFSVLDLMAYNPSRFRELALCFVNGESAGDEYLDALFLQMREHDDVTQLNRSGGRLHLELQLLKENLEDAGSGRVPRMLVEAYRDRELPLAVQEAFGASLPCMESP